MLDKQETLGLFLGDGYCALRIYLKSPIWVCLDRGDHRSFHIFLQFPRELKSIEELTMKLQLPAMRAAGKGKQGQEFTADVQVVEKLAEAVSYNAKLLQINSLIIAHSVIPRSLEQGIEEWSDRRHLRQDVQEPNKSSPRNP